MTSLVFVFLVAFLAIARTQNQNINPTKGDVDPPKEKTDPPKEKTDPPKGDVNPPKGDGGKPKECNCEGQICNPPTASNQLTVNCTEGQDICISVEDQFIGDKYSFQGCAKSSESVDGSFSFDFGRGVQVDIASKLCQTKDCPILSIVAPSIRRFENGRECPRCYKSGQSSCSANETLSCRGDMLTCTTVSGLIIEGNHKVLFAAQGCGTPSVCEITKKNSPVLFPSSPFIFQFDQVTCSSASGLAGFSLSLLVAVLSPCLLGLLTVSTFSA